MLNSIDAVFDGKVFHPEQPVTLKANTRVRIVIDNLSDENNELTSFLETAESLQLDGPSDWSENLDKYLYGEEKSMNPEKFLDTSYAIALPSSADDYHHKALVIAQQLKASKTPLITTRAIILEIGNALSKQKYRSKSIKLLSSLEKDKMVTIIPLSETLYQKAFQLYCQRNDKNWGIVDCISFTVMGERRITEALTTDIHFQQAGFRALLRD